MKMNKTLVNRYSYESTQRELSNEYQNDTGFDVYQKSLRSCALEESSFSIGKVKIVVEEMLG